MADETNDPEEKSNTDKIHKPAQEKSRSNALPRGQVASKPRTYGLGTNSSQPKPNPPSGRHFGRKPDTPPPGGGDQKRPAPDFKSAADKQRIAEFNRNAQDRSPQKDKGNDITR